LEDKTVTIIITMQQELTRQFDALIDADYPALGDLTESEFRAHLDPLRGTLDRAMDMGLGEVHTPSRESFVVVVTDALVPVAERVRALRLPHGAKPGVIDQNHGEEGLAPYRAAHGIDVPDAPAYLAIALERGDEFRDRTPADAVPVILQRNRSPLTIDEGIAWAAVQPAVLEKNHCFMLPGSSRGDKRVPALWIADDAPKLGWCWNGNHHTWLGIASSGGRLA